MSLQQHYWDTFMAWGLGLGFFLILIIIICVSSWYFNVDVQRRRNLKHQQKLDLQRMNAKAELARQGTDPEYIRYLEEKLRD